jgi:XTP/dITP diphosphohydrolase
MIVYVATSNPGKLRDFAAAAKTTGTEILPLPNLAAIPAPPEDEPTFEGNACTKAIYYSLRAPGLIVLADDSGLEVDALSGDPGVRSARFAEDAGFAAELPTDERNNRYLLHRLESVPAAERSGRYRCVLAAALDGKTIATADGSVEGSVLTAPRGNSGFGYDPLFLLPERGQTMAELEIHEKLSFSHRGKALAALLPKLHPAG